MIIINIIFLFFSCHHNFSDGDKILITIEDKDALSEHVRTYYITEKSFSIFEYPYPNLNNTKSKEIFYRDLSIKESKSIKDELNAIPMLKDFKSLYANLCLTTNQHFNVKFLQDGKYHITTVDHYYEARIGTLINIINQYAPLKLDLTYDKASLTEDFNNCEVHFNNPKLKDFVGNYQIQSENSLSEIDLYKNGTFTYQVRPAFSCWVWHKLEGKFFVENDILNLIILYFGEDIEPVPPIIYNFPDKIYMQKYQFYIDHDQLIAFESNEKDSCETFIKDRPGFEIKIKL